MLELLPDGSCLSVVARPMLHDKARNKLIAAARADEHLDPGQAVRVQVIEYDIPGRDGDGTGELIVAITTITDPALASAQELARAYCQRWEEETGHDPLKTCLRGPSVSSAAGLPTRPFLPDQREQLLAAVMADITSPRNLNPGAVTEAIPGMIRRARHNSYRVKRPGDTAPRYHGPPTIWLVNLPVTAMINLG